MGSALHDVARWLTAIVESSDDAIISKDLNGIVTSWNAGAQHIFGYSSEDAVGKSITIIVPPDLQDEEIEILKRLAAGDRIDHFETVRQTKSGEKLRVSLTISPVRDSFGTIIGASEIARDITERRLLEKTVLHAQRLEAPQEGEQRFSQFFATLQEYCYMISPDGNILDVNPAACKALGYQREELIGKHVSAIYAPESLSKMVGLLERCKGGEELHHEEMIIQAKDGHKRTVLLNVGSVKDAKDNLRYSASVQVDITDQNRIQERLRESEARFRLVANAAPVLIWMSGPDKLCDYFNSPWLQFTGRSLEQELGNGWAEGVHPEDRLYCLETYTTAFDRRESFKMEYRLRRHDGEYRWMYDLGVPRYNPEGAFAGYIGSCTDVTERKLAEEALSSVSRRLIEAHEEERGWIARELHDDINPRLALLAINLDRLKQDLHASAAEMREGIGELSNQVSGLGSDIHAMSHRLHSSKLDSLGLVAASAGFCRELSERQKVEIDFHSEGVPEKLSQEFSLSLFRVLQEALQNAAKHSGSRHFQVSFTGSSNEIHLTVHDQGIGFDPEAAMKGHGLGLTSMKERLKLIGGELSINSHLQCGTTIRVRVPLNIGVTSASAT